MVQLHGKRDLMLLNLCRALDLVGSSLFELNLVLMEGLVYLIHDGHRLLIAGTVDVEWTLVNREVQLSLLTAVGVVLLLRLVAASECVAGLSLAVGFALG